MNSTATESALIERILRGFRTEAHVRERLSGGGMLNIDRKLPYLVVYRQPLHRADAGTHRLVLGEASYLVSQSDVDDPTSIVAALAEDATRELDSFLIIELWAGPEGSDSFVVHAPGGGAATSISALQRGLEALQAGDARTRTVVRESTERHPPDLPPLLTAQECWEIGCLLVGLEVPPIYRDGATGAVYPVFLRRLRQSLSRVLRQAAFEFARVQTSVGIGSYHAMGPRRFGRELNDADEELAAIEQMYEMLLLVSPVNSDDAWRQFRDSGFDRAPEFRYRLLPFDPDELKRRLYNIDLEPVADPALAFLLRDKRDEIDRQITLLADRNGTGFRFTSMSLYGVVDDVLLSVARDILDTVPAGFASYDEVVDAAAFARLARAELDYYRAAAPELATEVQVRPDLVGLMVSKGNLLISDRLAIRPPRAAPLLHHEVGTHVLTWFNGNAQPLRMLRTGLAGYDELQEGLAVFAEYLAGGLDANRMRTLAGRVLAARSVEEDADFMETFRLLTDGHGFSAGAAFDMAERVHQSGGFTRDTIYLRGLLHLIEYIRADGAIEPLYIGKISARHVEIIEELMERRYLVTPPLVPRLFDYPETQERITAVRHGLQLTEMIAVSA